LRHPFIT